MIEITLRGGLGNQLFQYAAARIVAERLRCQLTVHSWDMPSRLIISSIGSRSILSELALYHPAVVQSLLGTSLQAARLISGENNFEKIHRRIFPNKYSPRKVTFAGVGEVEVFDPEFNCIASRTALSGFFQSPKYLIGYETAVRYWYEPSPAVVKEVLQNQITFPRPTHQMVAVHIRRGDYLVQRGTCADSELGWALPLDYYHRALNRLPSGLGIAFFSDDPLFVKEQFGYLQPWISPGLSAGIDLHLMSSCKYMILANSSFSWWAGYLNSHKEKYIIAPKYHIGWKEKVWVPGDIKVNDWHYLDV